MSLSQKATRAVGWMTGAKVLQQGIQFALSVILMRLLGPHAFGLIAMVLVFSGFAAIFAEFGFSSALVQRQEVNEEHRSSVFWMSLSLGLVLSGLFYFVAPLIADFYQEPLIKPITQWMSLNFVLIALGKVPRAMLEKNLQFDVIAKVTVVSLAVSGMAGVTTAFMGGGVWSLVVQRLAQTAVTSAYFLLAYRWRPRFLWSLQATRDLLGYSAGLTGFNVVNYWARSADSLLIGRYMGTEILGLYSRAYSLMLLPLSQLVSVIGPVMFPAMSSIKHDKPRVRQAYLRVMQVLTFIAFPMMLGLVVVASPFVRVVFGEQWLGVIPLIQIMGFVGIIQTVCNPCGWIYTSQGRTDWMFWWGLAGSAVLVLAILIGVALGNVFYVAVAYLIGNLILTPFCIAIPGRLIDMTLSDVWRAVRANLYCTLGMGALVWLAGLFVPPDFPMIFRLFLQIAVGVVVYLWLASQSAVPALRELNELKSRFYRRSNHASTYVPTREANIVK